ncbi:MAG: HAMP domain-containing protein [Rhizobiales bacterium]|nr:HAMP domain-containing protein [Hyphomicrobiales bacterium]
MRLPSLSISAKLYAIFALLATVTITLAAVAVINSRRHAALTSEFESAFIGAVNVQRVNALIYAAMMESRGIYMSTNLAASKKYSDNLIKFNDEIGAVLTTWQVGMRNEDAAIFSDFAVRLARFQKTREELAHISSEAGPQAAREWLEKAREKGEFREIIAALNTDIQSLADHYAKRSQSIYSEIDNGIENAARLLAILAFAAIVLAGIGAYVLWRLVARPLAEITRVTEKVADGDIEMNVPHRGRQDEIGAFARSIAIFQAAMRHNGELNRKISGDAEIRARNQQEIGVEITRFGAEVETTVAELGRIADQMLESSRQLITSADQAALRTDGAVTASDEASANVRDIASAADELTASVMEIERQVSQSNVIATKAVSEAERTNAAVTELDAAAKRIGDVIRLITDIAEQTNLLALNATIEAARAGDAGRGFAVVAGEVKALAGQTAKATEEIGTQISSMQKATTRSIEAIGAIERTIRQIGEISSAIAAAVTEQGAATQEIARSVETAARRTVETVDEVGRVGEATNDTRSSATAVKSVAEELGTVAGRIRAQVDQFFQRLRAA